MITMGINFIINVRHLVLVWFGISLVCGETYSSAACKEQELVCAWNELVAPENFLYIQKYALYERLKLLNASSDYSVALYEQNSHEMPFSIFHFCNNQKQSFPMEQYMFVMRLYYAKELEIERLWSLSPNSSELKSTILSFSSEYSVLTITGDRLAELAEDEETLVGDSDESLQNNKEYVETLSVVMRVAQDLLRFVEKDYLFQCITMNVTVVESDFFFKQQQIMISDIITYHMRHMEYPPEVAEKWNLIPLLYTYISQSIVPFINHILTTHQNSKLQAVPVMLVNQMSSYVVEKETFSSRLLVTDRQYNNVTLYSSILDDETSAAGTAAERDIVTLSNSLRMIFAVSEDVDVEKMLNNVNGYGSCTIAHLECLHYATQDNCATLSEHSDEDAKDKTQSVASHTVNQELCMSIKNVQIYNTVVVSPILSLLDRAERPIYTDMSAKHHRAMDTPLRTFMQLSGNNATDAVRKAIDYERSLLYHGYNYCPQGDETPKILILGLAAGELHNFLLRYFPCITVRSVDINLDMFLIAQKYFGFGHSVCSAKVYNNTTNEMVDIESAVQNNKVHNKEHIREIPGALDCRSEVIISDAWDYINYQVARNRYYNDPTTAQQQSTPYEKRINTVHYDLIMFDVYDMLAASWHGETDSGESSPFVDRAASDVSLTAVRDLLKPNVGIAVFHLHRDGQFSYYYNQIRKIFGSEQVVLFTVSGNDAMIVAGRDVFESETNLTEEQQVAEPQCYGNEGEDTTCKSYNDSSDSNMVIYKPIAHPCKAPLLFANHASWLTEHWGFREETVYASKYSLNCVDYWDD